LSHQPKGLPYRGMGVPSTQTAGEYQQSTKPFSEGQHADVVMNHLIDTLDRTRHGTHNGYNTGCRCEACMVFVANYRKSLRAKRKEQV
jgi:hypothetical protein